MRRVGYAQDRGVFPRVFHGSIDATVFEDFIWHQYRSVVMTIMSSLGVSREELQPGFDSSRGKSERNCLGQVKDLIAILEQRQ